MSSNDERVRAFNAARSGELSRLTRIQKSTDLEIIKQLRDAQAEIAQILGGLGDGAERSRLEALQREIARVLDEFARTAARTGTAALSSAWSAGAQLVSVPLAAANVSAQAVLNPRALRALERSLTGFIGDISTRTANRINAEIAQVMIGARPAAQAISNVDRMLGGGVRGRARQIVNDEIGRAYSSSSQASMEQAAERLPGLRKRWVKSGKLHPRPDHVAAHGQTVLVKESFVVGGVELLYPRDPNAPLSAIINCGCLSIPVTDGSGWGESTVRLDPFDAGVPLRVVRDPDLPAL